MIAAGEALKLERRIDGQRKTRYNGSSERRDGSERPSSEGTEQQHS